MNKISLATIALMAVLGALLSIAGSAHQADEPGVLLRAAIEKEEVDGDLAAAIVLYKQIIANPGKDAATTAKALFHLGWCHEKQGSQEARDAYRRLIDEYPGQEEEVARAKARLAELDARAGEASRKPIFRKIRIPANPENGVLSPDGKKFAFASQGSVWIVPIHGMVQPGLAGEAVRLTEPMGAWNLGNTMAWSGDGKWIAFNVWDKEGLGLYIVSSEGGRPAKIPISRDGQRYGGARISLSEDGRRVVFSSLVHQASAADPTAMSYFLHTVPVGGGTARRLTDFWAWQPAFSPDGRKIACARIDALDDGTFKQDLWIINSDGSAPLRLTDLPGRIRGPVWSPDGRMIAFNHQPSPEADSREILIQRVPRDGRNPGPPTKIEMPLESTCILAGWTPDNKIGLLMQNPLHQAVYTVPTGGGKATQVTREDPDLYPLQPRWSPDGKALSLRWGAGSIVSVPAQGGELTVVHDADKTDVVAGTPGGGYGISPDGKTIVFSAYRKGSQPLEVSIWTVPITGGEPRQITQGPSPTQDRYPCWSPDGRYVAFLRYEPGPDPIPQIFVTSFNGGTARRITSEDHKVGLGSIDWSPDGKTIAYFSRDDTINLVPAAGGEHEVLSDMGSMSHNWFSDLAWSPDGNELAYTAAGRLMVVSLKNGQTREVETGVLDKGATDFYIDWSPDGSKFAFSAGYGGDDELWLMEDFLHLIKIE